MVPFPQPVPIALMPSTRKSCGSTTSWIRIQLVQIHHELDAAAPRARKNQPQDYHR